MDSHIELYAVSYPSGVWDEASADIDFGVF